MSGAPQAPSARQSWQKIARSWRLILSVAAGFLLSLGWVWFNGAFTLTVACMPNVFFGTLFSGGGIDAFAATLLGGFVAGGFAAKHLARWDERLPAVSMHGCAFACMLAGAFGCETYPRVSAALFGMAAAVPGVYWTTRLVALPPAHAGTAMALSALIASILAPAVAVWPLGLILPIGIVLALGLSRAHGSPQSDEKECVLTFPEADGAPARIGVIGWRGFPFRKDILPLIALAAAFFAFGILAPAEAAPTSLSLPISATGIAVMTIYCVHRRDGVLGIALLSAAMVIPTVLLTLFLPGLPGATAFLEGMMEGAAIIAIAQWRRERRGTADQTIQPFDYSSMGVCLVIVFVLVNTGGLIGGLVTKTDNSSYWLAVAVCIALSPVVLPLSATWSVDSPKGGEEREEHEAVEINQCLEMKPTVLEATLYGVDSYLASHNLTAREKEVAVHMLRGRLTREIAVELCISEHTVKTHVKNVLKKFDLPHRKAFVSAYLLQMEEVNAHAIPSAADSLSF